MNFEKVGGHKTDVEGVWNRRTALRKRTSMRVLCFAIPESTKIRATSPWRNVPDRGWWVVDAIVGNEKGKIK